MRRMVFLFATMLLAFRPMAAAAQTSAAKFTYTIQPSGEGFATDSIHSFEVLTTAPDVIDIESALNSRAWREEHQGRVAVFFPGSQALWFRYNIHNASPHDKWVIFDQNTFLHDDVQVFVRDESGSIQRRAWGNIRLDSDEAISSRIGHVTVTIPSGTTATVVFRVITELPVRNEFEFEHPHDFARFADYSTQFHATIIGFLLGATLLAGLLALTLKDVVFGWFTAFYASFLAIAFINVGFFSQLLGAPAGMSAAHLVRPAMAAAVITAAMQARTFFDTTRCCPRLDKALWSMVIGGALLAVWGVVGHHATLAHFAAENILFIGTSVLVIITAFMQWRAGYRHAGTFLLGWVFMGGSVVIYVAALNGALPPRFLLLNAPYVGDVLHALVMVVFAVHRIMDLQQLRAEARIAGEQRDELKTLLRIVSHDLVTPLTIAMNTAKRGLLSATAGAAAPRDAWERVVNAMERQRSILEKVRQMRMLADSKVRLALEPTPVGDLISSAIRDAQPHLDKKSCYIFVESAPSSDLLVMADPVFARQQVLGNVISNAVKFSHEGSVITIAADASDNEVVIRVSDNGVGIPTDLIDDLFDPSKPTTRAGTANESGSGYGLPIVKNFMDLFGGRVQVDSRTANQGTGLAGTTVRLTFARPQKTRPARD